MMSSPVCVIALCLFLLGSSYAATPSQCAKPEGISECGIGGVCVRITADLSKCSCYPGYQVNYTTYECADVDECIYPGAALCRNGRCMNTEGTYKCLCQQGYVPHFPDGKSCVRRRETGFFGIPWFALSYLIGEF